MALQTFCLLIHLFDTSSKLDNTHTISLLLDEYDHLDYSRPSHSKPQYHKMNDTVMNINSDEEKPSNHKNIDVLPKIPEDCDAKLTNGQKQYEETRDSDDEEEGAKKQQDW